MYPICLNIKDRLCVVAGGGRVAQRKVWTLLEEAALVCVISPAITAPLHQLVEEQKIEWREKQYTAEDLNGAFMVFAATGERSVQDRIYCDAAEKKILVNVVDDPDASTFHVPARFCRGNLEITISTGGASPAMSALIRRRLERDIGEEYALHLEIAALLRERVIASFKEEERADMFRQIAAQQVTDWIRKGQWDHVEEYLNSLLGSTPEIDWPGYKQD